MRPRSSASSCGRPTRGRDFHRQYARKPRQCQRVSVSGLMTPMAFRIDGQSRYSQTNWRRSEFVSCTRLGSLRSRMLSCRRRTRFSASSLARDLKSERSVYPSSFSHSAMRRQPTRPACHTDPIFGNDNGSRTSSPNSPRRHRRPPFAADSLGGPRSPPRADWRAIAHMNINAASGCNPAVTKGEGSMVTVPIRSSIRSP